MRNSDDLPERTSPDVIKSLNEIKANQEQKTDEVKSALILGLFTWIIISEKPNQREEDNDLKYRYIKMKGDASAEQIATLEDIFELNRNNEVINQMSEDVETYEEAVRKQAALAEQARLKEQAAKEQESKANSIKNKQDDSKVNLNNKSKP